VGMFMLGGGLFETGKNLSTGSPITPMTGNRLTKKPPSRRTPLPDLVSQDSQGGKMPRWSKRPKGGQLKRVLRQAFRKRASREEKKTKIRKRRGTKREKKEWV